MNQGKDCWPTELVGQNEFIPSPGELEGGRGVENKGKDSQEWEGMANGIRRAAEWDVVVTQRLDGKTSGRLREWNKWGLPQEAQTSA